MLPLNIINEKIFVVLWFWLICVALLSFLQLIYRAATYLSPDCRFHIIRVFNRLADYKTLLDIHNRCDIGDWFMLLQMGKNIDPLSFKEILGSFARYLRDDEGSEGRMNGKRALRESKLVLKEDCCDGGGMKKAKMSQNDDVVVVVSPKFE